MKRIVSFRDNSGIAHYGVVSHIDPNLYPSRGGVAHVQVGQKTWTVEADRLTDVPIADSGVVPTEARIKAEADAKVDHEVEAALFGLGGRCLLGELAKRLDWEPVKLAAITRRMAGSGRIASSKVRIGNEMRTMLVLAGSVEQPPE